MLRIVVDSGKYVTFVPAFEKQSCKRYLVPWMSGLVSGLQNRVRRFESARYLSSTKSPADDSVGDFAFYCISTIYKICLSGRFLKFVYRLYTGRHKKLRLYTMINVHTYLRKHNPDAENGVVWITFYINRERVNFSTKVPVESKNWNDKKKFVTTGDKHAADKNLIIENIHARINNVLVKYRLKDKKLTKETFLRAYHRPSDYNTFFEYVTAQQKKLSSRMEMSTFLMQLSVMNKLREYSPNLHFDDITRDWLDDYFIYLQKELDNNLNTAYKNMGVIKKYVRLAYKDGYMDENPFNDWHIKKTTASCVYLTEEELDRLLTLYKSGELEYKLHKTLEFFLFLCFSSLHVGDAKNLSLEQFSETSFTYFRLKLRNKKPEPIVVPISVPLRAIIRNIVGTRKRGRLFEKTQAEQTMNRNLKRIAELAEIDKNLTHKVGRHTFATIFLRKTKDIAALREILGHSDISETLVYAHVLEESKQEGIQCFNDFDI